MRNGVHQPMRPMRSGGRAGVHALPVASRVDSLREARLTQRAPSEPSSGRWLLAFIGVEISAQLVLALVDLGGARAVFRIAVFGASLALLFLPSARIRHPALWAAIGTVVLLALEWFHPLTRPIAGLAQIALNVAILAPIVWVCRLKLDAVWLRRVMLLLWAFHTLSSAVGILQVYFPGKFQTQLSSAIESQGEDYVESLRISTNSGAMVFRPMGLSGEPGGAAISGFYAVLLGVALLLSERKRFLRIASAASMVCGMACIYLGQARVVLVYLAISLIALGIALLVRRETGRFVALGGSGAAMILAGFAVAVGLAGSAVTSRLRTFGEHAPGEVYYQNRGRFLEATFAELIPEHPLGAGLGRWGMVSHYFDEDLNAKSTPIWVELQWTGWAADGGLLLIALYLAALWAAFRTTVRIGRTRTRTGGVDLGFWAAVIAAYDVGAFALTFSYSYFISQQGMDFWVFNAMIFVIAHREGLLEGGTGSTSARLRASFRSKGPASPPLGQSRATP